VKKKTIVVLSIAAVAAIGAVAIAGPIIYRDLIVGPAEAAPTVQAPTPDDAASTTPSDDLSGTWSVAADSFAGYRVDEVLNGTNVTVVGRTAEVSGSFDVETLTLTAAEVSVDVASIETDSANRDDYFRSSALNVSQFPDATFRLLEPASAAAPPVGGEVQTVSVRGELTLNGETKQVDAEVQAVLAGDGGQVSGSVPITFADFGVEAPNLGFVSVEPSGSIEFLLNIEPA
jgi:polyisoprenoid-binding protein YceI